MWEKNKQTGFTIVELLIVIVVIAILAAIVIVSYNGILRAAAEASLKADLHSANSSIEMYKVLKGNYPDDLANVNDGQGVNPSESNSLSYFKLSGGYCVQASRSNGLSLNLSSLSGSIAKGGCSVVASLDIKNLSGKMVVGWASHDLATLPIDESNFGIKNGMVSTYVDFVQSPEFPVGYLQAAETRGAPLLISLEPWDWSVPANQQPTFAPRLIASGSQDAHITAWLEEAQSYASRTQIIVRFAPEMNDTSRPWASGIGTVGYAESTPAEYIAMWRHVAEIHNTVAPNVLLMWNPLNFGAGPHQFESFYPGDAYVDVLGVNGFNWSDQRIGSPGWQDPTAVFGFNDQTNGSIPRIKALAGSKPWGIAEAASAPDVPAYFQPGGKYHSSYGSWVFDWPENPPYEATAADWITQEGWTRMLIRRACNTDASFVNLFHTNKETDWRLTDTASGKSVFTDSRAWNANITGGVR